MRAIVLASRPVGTPSRENFEMVEVDGEKEKLRAGQVRLRPRWFSVDPYMRGRMNDVPSYIPPFRVGEPITSEAIAEVIESTTEGLSTGDLVRAHLAWQEESVLDARFATKISSDPGMSPTYYLGAMGMPGLTAYVGLFTVGHLREGDVVFISGAAGAVGSIAGQIAKTQGNFVIGSAGSDTKVDELKQLGFDAVFNYKKSAPKDALRSLAPNGIDLYFDNVGGDHLEAAIGSLRNFGRVSLCGAISQYNSTGPTPGPRNFEGNVIRKRLEVRGFIVSDHQDERVAFERDMTGWISSGKVKVLETIYEGFSSLPDAFLGLFSGSNNGKMLVAL